MSLLLVACTYTDVWTDPVSMPRRSNTEAARHEFPRSESFVISIYSLVLQAILTNVDLSASSSSSSSFLVSHRGKLLDGYACRASHVLFIRRSPIQTVPRQKFHPLGTSSRVVPQKERKVSPGCVLSACPRAKSSRLSYNFRSILVVVEKDQL